MRRPRELEIVRHFPENGMKVLLQDPGNVRDLLTLAHSDAVPLIDFARLKAAPTTFVARDWRHTEVDLLLTAPLIPRGGPRRRSRVWLYLLIEHQSRPDPLMPLRLLDYVTQILKSQLRQWERDRPPSAEFRGQPVLPVVLYTGKRRWQSLGRLVDLLEFGERFARVTPAFEPLFVNLPALPGDQLLREGGAFGRVLRLLQARTLPVAEFVRVLEEMVQGLQGMARAERGRWRELLMYLQMLVYHDRGKPEREPLYEVIEEAAGEDPERREVRAMKQTILESIKAEGRKKGRKEGAQTSQQILLRLLEVRFGELPSQVVQAVLATHNLRRLQDWADRAKSVPSLDDVGILSAH